MSSADTLLPIPEDSSVGRDLARMEHAYQLLRDVAEAEGALELFSVSGESRGGGSSSFDKIFTRANAPFDFQAFYHYYGLQWRSPRWVSDYSPARLAGAGPQWFRFSSESSAAWVRVVPKMLQALAGLPVSVTRSSSWRWDYKNLTESGRPLYVPVFEALLCLRDESHDGLLPDAALPELLANICTVAHPLSNKNLFDWQKQTCGRGLFHMYSWLENGFRASFATKKSRDEAKQLLFKDFVTKDEPREAGRGWRVFVDLREIAVPPSDETSSTAKR